MRQSGFTRIPPLLHLSHAFLKLSFVYVAEITGTHSYTPSLERLLRQSRIDL
jgi:hypothetical protein